MKAQSNVRILQLRQEAKTEADKEIAVANKRAEKLPDAPIRAPREPRVVPESTAMKPTVTGKKAKRIFIMPDPPAKGARKVGVKSAGPKQPKRATEEMILKKYHHARKGTLQFDPDHNKQSVEAKLECGHIARVFTSDLFQIKRCSACRKAKDKAEIARLSKTTAQRRIMKARAKKA